MDRRAEQTSILTVSHLDVFACLVLGWTCGAKHEDVFEGDTVVYFIQMGNDGPIKIGVTSGATPESRLSSMQTGNPFELRILATIPSDRANLESEVHELFSHLWIRGEWFRPDQELLDFIQRTAVPWPYRSESEPPAQLIAMPPMPSAERLATYENRYRALQLEWFDQFADGKTLKEIAKAYMVPGGMILSAIKEIAGMIRSRDARITRIEAITESRRQQAQQFDTIKARLASTA